MELYEKTIIRNEKEAADFINNWNSNKVRNYLSVEDFKKYPALLCYSEDDNDYSMSYSSQGYWSITYLDDFYDWDYNDKAKNFLEYLEDEKSKYYELENINEGYALIKVIDKFKEIFNYEK